MKRTHGFTIVELLVVISIIALLVSVLLPSLTKARKEAQVTLCMSQLRQNGIAIISYQSGNKDFFPLFGGIPVTDPYGRVTSTYNGPAVGWARYAFNPDFVATGFFQDYLNAQTGSGQYKSRPLLNCPLVNFTQATQYHFEYADTPSYYDIDLASYGIVGYNYYPGRQLANSTQGNFSTIPRRNDPKELLVTDQLMQQATQNNPPYGYTTAVPWFNPHEGRSCLTTRNGDAFQLVASGVVERFSFINASLTDWTGYANYYANASFVGPAPTLADGPYANGPYWASNN